MVLRRGISRIVMSGSPRARGRMWPDFHEDQLANGCLVLGWTRFPATYLYNVTAITFLEVTVEARSV